MERVEELERAIRRHNKLYWLENNPEIPDTLYDQLVEELREIDPRNPVLQEIGAGADSRGKVSHLRPMLSLKKCYDLVDLEAWMKKTSTALVVSPKVDGLALSLRYDHRGHLSTAVTRGDGRKGDDVTQNVIRVSGVPVKIFLEATPVEIRGEVYMPISSFEDLNKKGGKTLANPRNAAAGALKRKNPLETAELGLQFVAYDLLGYSVPTETAKMMILGDLDFDTPPWRHIKADNAMLQWAVDYFSEQAEKLDYETDGIVFKVDRVERQYELGSTSHHPRYMVAWKFRSEGEESVLRDVIWQVSRTGSINPVAVIDDVELEGAVVNRVSLHNLSIIDDLGIGIGSTVIVSRRGGVIPHIERGDKGEREIEPPDHCPGCGSHTYEEGDFLHAHHSIICHPMTVSQFVYFASNLGLKGIGEKHISTLVELGYLRPMLFSDLFVLAEEKLAEAMGEKNAMKLNQKRKRLINRVDEVDVLTALGIPLVGRTVAEKVIKAVGGIRQLVEVAEEVLMEIEGIGPEIAASIHEYCKSWKSNILFLFSILKPVGMTSKGKLNGQVFLFTGKLQRYTRSEAEDFVKKLGGSVSKSMTKSVTCVVTSDELAEDPSKGTSSKIVKARETGVEIIGETEFVKRCVRDAS